MQGVIGFGLGLLCAPVVYFIMPELVPVPMILNALLVTLLLSVKHHSNIDFKQSAWSIVGGTAGVVIAGVVLVSISNHQYQLLFGISILVAVALSLVGFTPRVSVLSNLLVSAVSGFMGTTTSAGGAPMGLLYQSEERSKIKANLSVFFVYINLFGVLVLWASGCADYQDLLLFFQCAPAIILGWLLSTLVDQNIDEQRIRQLILLIASISGLVLIFVQ